MPKRMYDWLRKQYRIDTYCSQGGTCANPGCKFSKEKGAQPWCLKLSEVQLDHITPLSSGGSNGYKNLRVLCRRCHSLRAGRAHESMRGIALKRGELTVEEYQEGLW